MLTAEERRSELARLSQITGGCTRCPELVATRTQVVFGVGDPDADVLFVGEAPGADEDREGVPFIGRSGQLLTSLLAEIGLRREDVFIANVLKCRPPDNRNPARAEIAHCREYLDAQLALIQPLVVCTLGNFATRLLREGPERITDIRGRPEIVTLGTRTVRLLPMLHPAAALYKRTNIELLRADIGLLPELLALGAPEQTAAPPAEPVATEELIAPQEPVAREEPVAHGEPSAPAEPPQLDLF